MSRMQWFRMYHESRNDSKLDALSDKEFRIWHKLLCYSAESQPRGVVDCTDMEFVAIELRVDPEELESAIERMVRVRLVECAENTVTFPSFESRQYDKPSDLPEATRERKRRQRERDSHDESRAVTHRADTETDTEQSREGARASEIEQPETLATIPDCLDDTPYTFTDELASLSPGENTSRGHIRTAAENRYGMLSPADYGSLGDAITRRCIPGCSRSPDQAYVCARQVIGTLKRAPRITQAAKWIGGDARERA